MVGWVHWLVERGRRERGWEGETAKGMDGHISMACRRVRAPRTLKMCVQISLATCQYRISPSASHEHSSSSFVGWKSSDTTEPMWPVKVRREKLG